MVEPPRLVTDRLVLRGFLPRDVAPHLASARDPDVQRFLGGPRGPYDAFSSLATHAGHWALRGYGSWMVERRSDGEPLGRVGLWHPETWPDVEIGWRFHRAAWGQGYATESARAALGWAWTTQPFDHLISLIVPDNAPSQRLAQRLGHVRTGPVEVESLKADVWRIERPPGDEASNIRPATREDAGPLRTLVQAAFEDYTAISPPGWTPREHTVEEEHETLDDPDARTLVAVPGGVLAGVVSYVPASLSRLRSDDPGLIHFRRLFIHPGWHGSGLAQRLHQRAVDDCRARGFTSMVLFTPQAQGRARRFYERQGWRHVADDFSDERLGMPTAQYAYTL
jgi:RimJ/RimL family protein N-acetyltransferase/ribosomal protein S18 acetylase RimI-like enzyme